MARLIDAESVEYSLLAITDSQSGVPKVLAEWLANVVRNAPTVDAVEVVHGRWVAENEESIRCSECCFNRVSIKIPMDYCPNCGAKMDGERKDND